MGVSPKQLRSEARMNRELAWFSLKFLSPHCFFCKRKFIEDPAHALSFGHRRHNVLRLKVSVHHIDKDRTNNNFSNLAICHRSCHEAFHASERNTISRRLNSQQEEPTLV